MAVVVVVLVAIAVAAEQSLSLSIFPSLPPYFFQNLLRNKSDRIDAFLLKLVIADFSDTG